MQGVGCTQVSVWGMGCSQGICEKGWMQIGCLDKERGLPLSPPPQRDAGVWRPSRTRDPRVQGFSCARRTHAPMPPSLWGPRCPHPTILQLSRHRDKAQLTCILFIVLNHDTGAAPSMPQA